MLARLDAHQRLDLDTGKARRFHEDMARPAFSPPYLAD
jgi:hypothetical protein